MWIISNEGEKAAFQGGKQLVEGHGSGSKVSLCVQCLGVVGKWVMGGNRKENVQSRMEGAKVGGLGN